MSEPKAKVKVKVKSEEAGEESKPLKSPQPGKAAVKVKKEAKQEPESPPVAKKKHSQTPVKAVKKEIEVSIKSLKKEEGSKGDSTGKLKVVKKEEVVASNVSSVKKKKKASKDEPEKREKKVFSLPGQKHDPPNERDPLRIFYETLYQQNSNSEMAEVWMMEHGLLEADVAKKAFERKKKNQASQKLGTPVKQSKEVKVEKKSSTTVHIKSHKKSPVEKSGKKSTSGNADSKPAKVKRIRDSDDDDDDDDDFIAKPKKKAKASA